MDYIISWFFAEQEGNESSYMQINAKSTSGKFQKTYWKCILCFFYSSLRKNKNAKHILYTNINNFPKIDGVDTKKFFEKNNIEIRLKELSNQTPKDWYKAWRNQFYVFDILTDLSNIVKNDDAVIIVDSDCIINNNLDNLFNEIRKLKAVCYEIKYRDDHNINGINIKQMGQLYKQFYGEDKKIGYYGGEFIAVKGEIISRIVYEYHKLWNLNYLKYKNNQIKLNEEAHFLSIIYHKINVENSSGNHYIKRIWNGFNYNNYEKKDKYLDIYHLPAQKVTGFSYFFKKIVKRSIDYSQKDLLEILDLSLKKSEIRCIKEILTKLYFKYVDK